MKEDVLMICSTAADVSLKTTNDDDDDDEDELVFMLSLSQEQQVELARAVQSQRDQE